MIKPTPVIIRRNNVESWSTWKAKGILKAVTFMKSKRFTITGVDPKCFASKKIPTLTTNEASITPQPIMPIIDLVSDLRPSPLIRKPIKGKSGTK